MPVTPAGEIHFTLGSAPTFQFKDVTDLTGVGGVKVGVLKSVKLPNGSILYENEDYENPDIEHATSLFSQSFAALTDDAGEVISGNYEIEYGLEITGGGDAGEYELTVSINYAHAKPSMNISMVSECKTSKLVSKDVTVWGDNLDSITYNHKTKYPDTMLEPIADVEGDTDTNTIIPIWTGIYSSVIVATTVFVYEDYVVNATYSKAKTHNVVCNENLCCIFSCLEQLYAKIVENVNNPAIYSRLIKKSEEVKWCLHLYYVASDCGNETKQTEYYERMKSLLASECCTCNDSSSGISQLVVPIASYAYASKIISGASAPTSGLGYDGWGYIRTTDFTMWIKDNGTWTSLGSIKGGTAVIMSGAGAPDSGDGNNGDYYINETNGDFYGPKASGAWPGSPFANLTGPQGDQGDPGARRWTYTIEHTTGGATTTNIDLSGIDGEVTAPPNCSLWIDAGSGVYTHVPIVAPEYVISVQSPNILRLVIGASVGTNDFKFTVGPSAVAI